MSLFQHEEEDERRVADDDEVVVPEKSDHRPSFAAADAAVDCYLQYLDMVDDVVADVDGD